MKGGIINKKQAAEAACYCYYSGVTSGGPSTRLVVIPPIVV